MKNLSVIIPTAGSSTYIEKSIKYYLHYLYEAQDIGIINKFELLIIAQQDWNIPSDLFKTLRNMEIHAKELKIFRLIRLGKGNAISYGILKSHFNLCLIIDDDLEYPIEALPRLLDEAKHSDIIIGSRLIKGSKRIGVPLDRLLLSWCYRTLVKFTLFLTTKDIQSGMKLIRKNSIEGFEASQKGFVWDTELLHYLELNEFNIAEVPITYTYIKKTKTLVNGLKMLKDYLKLFWKAEFGEIFR